MVLFGHFRQLNLERTLDKLMSIVNITDRTRLVDRLTHLVYPWLVDQSFHVEHDVHTQLIDLMNKHVREFFRHCFLPWLQCTTIEHAQYFFSHLFTSIDNQSNQNQLCIYICENRTCSWNDNELVVISHWLESKQFYFSIELFEYLPEKCAMSALTYADRLSFAKVLHRIISQIDEHNYKLRDEQRRALKQAITMNTTILSDILADLFDS
jgi:hypothetical protein